MSPFGIEECDAWVRDKRGVRKVERCDGKHTSDRKLDGHKEPQKVEGNLQNGPFLGPEEPVRPRGKDEGVPSGDGEGTYEEVLVGR